MKKQTLNQRGGAWAWVLVAVAAVAAVWVWYSAKAPEVAGPPLSNQDTTDVLEEELRVTDLGDVDAEMQVLEEDLQAL